MVRMSVSSIGLGGRKERSTQLWNLCWMDERKENGLLGREPYCLSVTVVVVVMKSKADREGAHTLESEANNVQATPASSLRARS